MNILAIESSCDETAAAVVRGGREVLSSAVLSQIDMHALYGGVVPEIASRRHIEVVEELTETALSDANLALADVDALAVTFAPGLIGALLVGVNFAKSLAYALGKPLVPVHHIRGHVAANYLAFRELEPPFLALVASGGHTLLLGVDGYTAYRVLGSTRDDAAGEAFDKIARVLGLGYPGGQKLDKLASGGREDLYPLPRAKLTDAPFDVSFSGLKTAAINLIRNAEARGEALVLPDFAASFQAAVADALVPRVFAAARHFGYRTVAASGGVAANSKIRSALAKGAEEAGVQMYLAPLALCGDNAAMIGSQAYYEYISGVRAPLNLNAYATLAADYASPPET
ncbi:tRNA (adenosine(37)-N6)-threonylcarbamoyltransferase complex transferase subunit TsaD [Oscillospiraceae bacterium OttesenSCG-928-G22]|nr:tRNA (adenosine(37)-N6)-threonylcarbamoyltransferase complex transferase subunit TsaD [Oscillospiraceae bacterium OttesenSCG-928-G22]